MGRASNRKVQARAQMASLRAVLECLVPAVRAEVLRVYGPDSCISSTNVLLRALAALGIPAEAVAVRVALFNAAFALRAAREKRWPGSEEELQAWTEESGAWSVGIGYVPPGGLPKGAADFHLVAVVAGTWLVDPSLDQASRPQYRLELGPGAFTLGQRWETAGQLVTRTGQRDAPVYVRYERLSEQPNWQRARDWTNPLNDPLAAAALQRSGLLKEKRT